MWAMLKLDLRNLILIMAEKTEKEHTKTIFCHWLTSGGRSSVQTQTRNLRVMSRVFYFLANQWKNFKCEQCLSLTQEAHLNNERKTEKELTKIIFCHWLTSSGHSSVQTQTCNLRVTSQVFYFLANQWKNFKCEQCLSLTQEVHLNYGRKNSFCHLLTFGGRSSVQTQTRNLRVMHQLF